MLLEDIKSIAQRETEKGSREGLIINLIKEYLQNLMLEFIYSNKNTNNLLVFTGGTCLRFCFNLPRLSEDLDFDTAAEADRILIGEEIKDYFKKNLKYKEIDLSIKGKEKKIYLKFPLLKEIGLKYKQSSLLLLKIEIARADTKNSRIETSLVEKNGKTYFLKRYSLEDMMSGKINAFLTRMFYKGKENEIDFKGRDMFDLVWYMGKGVEPNLIKLKTDFAGTKYENMQWNEILKEIQIKSYKIKKNHIQLDLINFIEDAQSIDNFLNNYLDVINQYCRSHGLK